MKTNKRGINLVDGIIKHPENEIIKTKRTWLEKDIVLNVGFKESLIRCIIALFAPIPLLVNHTLLFAAIPVMFYLFVTGLMHFCPIKYVWQHWVKHIPDPTICDLAIDLDIPVKTI